MMNKSTTFESQLRKAVRRLSQGNHDESIREVVDHYQDLSEDAIGKENTAQEVEAMANHRIGNVGDIARKIVDSPIRIKKGLKLQWLGAILWVLAPFLSFGAFWILRNVTPNESFSQSTAIWISILITPSSIYFLSGIVFATGAFQSQRINFRSLAVGLTTYSILTAVAIGYASRPGQPYESTVRLHEEYKRQIALEPRFERLEASIAACSASGENATIQEFEAFRAAVTPGPLPGIDIVKHPLKYVYVAEHSIEDRGYGYRMRLNTTDSLADARSKWWSAGSRLQQDLPRMESARKAYFEHMKSIASESVNPWNIGTWIVFRYCFQFLFAMGLALLFLRIRLYRSDTFRFHRN